MTNMAGVAKEVFQVLLRYDYVVKMYDDSGMDEPEPSEARRFFAQKPNLMVVLNDADDDSSIKLMFGKSTHANDIDGLIQALRTTATKYNMSFQDNQFGKEIDPKDYRNLASVSESKRERDMQLCEGMYGTTRSSYLLLDNAKMIVHHTSRINLKEANARAHNIESIFIEDASGTRLQFPTRDLKAARALAEQVNKGGVLTDAAAQAVVEAHIPPPVSPMKVPYLAENNPVIRDFMNWTERFSPNRALLEYNDPDSRYEDHHERATEEAVHNFDVEDFLASPAGQDLFNGRSLNPEEGDSEIPRKEILSLLAHYLNSWIESYSDFPDFNGETGDIAKHLYPQVEAAIKQGGWSVVDEGIDSAPSAMPSNDSVMEMVPEGDDEFTREDILLPNKDQGAGLAREVTKSMVHDDPTNPDEEHPPESAYLRRMQTLAGVHSGHQR